MFDWPIIIPTFLAASVEWVEAFTIVLAVSLSIGWRGATQAVLAALVVLAVMTVITGGVIHLGIPLSWLRFATGVLLLLFGVRWFAKAIARAAGLKALHDEEREFAHIRIELSASDRKAAWVIAFKGVLLEGFEVWLIVSGLGIASGTWTSGAGAAGAALLVVAIVGLCMQAPLRRVPENAIKFFVGAMIVAFGIFWTMEVLIFTEI